MNNCQETRLLDIVGVTVYPAAQCSLPIPPQVPTTSLPDNDYFPSSPALSLQLSPASDEDGMLSDMAQLKSTSTRTAAGLIYTHDLSMTTLAPRTSLAQAVNALLGTDFHVVITRGDGSKQLLYALPNTPLCDIETNDAASSSTSIKIKLSSMSLAIDINT